MAPPANDGGAGAPPRPPPPHNLTSRKAKARAERMLSGTIARLRPPPRDGNDGDDSQTAASSAGDAAATDPESDNTGRQTPQSPPPADTAIEARARAAPTVAAFCCSEAATAATTVPDLPWRDLPPSADPSSVLSAEHRAGARGRKKRAQVANFAAVLRRLAALLLIDQEDNCSPPRPLRVVDFGCGSGAVVLALAALFPPDRAVFVGVDMKLEAVDVLRRRAAEAGFTHVTGVVGMAEDFCWGCSGGGGGGDGDDGNANAQQQQHQQHHTFDVALALHACGNATDVAIELAARSGAAFAVSPCCLGKLRFSARGGSSFHPALRVLQSTRRGAGERLPPLSDAIATQEAREAAAAEERRRRGCPWALEGRVRVRHPRSEWLRRQLSAAAAAAAPSADHGNGGAVDAAFTAIARAADGVNHGELRAVLGAAAADADGALELRAARAAKAVVETDRAEAMCEAHGYAVALLRLSPLEEEDGGNGGQEASNGVGARDDLLLGVPGPASNGGGQLWAGARAALSNLRTN